MTMRASQLAARILLGLILAAVCAALALLTILPRAVGGNALTVLSGSMSPRIPVGSVVLVRPVDPYAIKLGDIITFQRESGREGLSTHRVIEIHEGPSSLAFTTKGDANQKADSSPVPAEAIEGRVWFSIPHLGTIRSALGIRGSGLGLLTLGLISYALVQVVSALRDRRTDVSAGTSTQPSTEAAEMHQLQLLVVTLPITVFDGLTPALVARLLRMDIVDEGVGTFTLALVREPAQLDELEVLLQPFAAISVQRSAPVMVPCCPTMSLVSPSDEVGDVAA